MLLANWLKLFARRLFPNRTTRRLPPPSKSRTRRRRPLTLASRSETLEPRVLLSGVVAQVDTYNLPADAPLQSPSSVLDNDSGEGLTAQLVTGPEYGQLTLAADGTFTYTPAAGWSGTDSFTYAAADGLDTATATVYLHVAETPSLTEEPLNSGAGSGTGDGSTSGDATDETYDESADDETSDETTYDGSEEGPSATDETDSEGSSDGASDNESTEPESLEETPADPPETTDDGAAGSDDAAAGDSSENSTDQDSNEGGEEINADSPSAGNTTTSQSLLPEFMSADGYWTAFTAGANSFDNFWPTFQPTISGLASLAASFGALPPGNDSSTSDSSTDSPAPANDTGAESAGETAPQDGGTLGENYAAETARIKRDYEERLAAIESTRQTSLASAERGFAITRLLADALLTGIAAAAELVLNLRVAALDATYNVETAAADVAYDLRMAAAEQTFTTIAGEAGRILSERLAELVSAFQTAVSSAEQTRDAAVPEGIPFNPWGHIGDAIYAAVDAMAQAARQTRIDAAVQAYSEVMAALESAYNSAIALADVNFYLDVQAADTAYDARVAAANGVHSAAIARAESEFAEATAPLQSTLDSKLAAAAEVLDREFSTAELAHAREVASATEERDDRVADANRVFDEWMATAPGTYATAARSAAGVLAERARSAAVAYRQAVDEANATHRQVVETAALANQGIGDPFLEFGTGTMTPAHLDLNAFAAEQYEIYETALAEGGSEPELRYTLLSAVVEFAASKVADLASEYLETTRSVYEAVAAWVEQVAEADYNLAVALAQASADQQKALELAQADYIDALAGQEKSLGITYQQKLADKTREIAQAHAAYERRVAGADAQMATTKASANHTYSVAAADAEKEFADKYTDAWEDREEKLSNAAATHATALSTAASQWVDDIIAADQRWVADVIDAAEEFEHGADGQSGAAAAYTQVVGEIVSAVEDYSETMLPEWEAAIREYHSPEAFPDLNPADLDAAINAWKTYETTVVGEWASAHTSAAGAVNAYYSRMQAAANDRLDAEAHAAQTRADDVDTARAKAATEAIAAQQQYDATIRTAVAGRARVLAQAEQTRATAVASAEETAVTDTASAYETARTDQANADETYTVGVANLQESLQTDLISTSYGELETLNQDSRTLSEEAAEQIVANARTDAGNIRDARNRVAQTSINWRVRAAGEAGRRAADAAEAARTFIADPGNTYSIPLSSDPNNYALHIWEEFTFVPEAGDLLNEAARRLCDSVCASSDEGSGNPNAAADVLSAMLGFQPGVRTALHDQSGDEIGLLDPDTALVRRYGYLPTGEHVPRDLDYELVLTLSLMDRTPEEWNEVFGFAPESISLPPIPETQTLTYKLISFFIPEETLLRHDQSDGAVTLTLATEVVGLIGIIDPTGLTTPVAIGLNVLQGHYGQAAADVVVPVGLGKLVKYIKRFKAAKMQRALETISQKADDVAAKLDEATEGASAAVKGVFSAPNPGRTNSQLVQDIATRAESAVGGVGHAAGTKKHKYAERMLDRYQTLFGQRGLHTEVRYKRLSWKSSGL